MSVALSTTVALTIPTMRLFGFCDRITRLLDDMKRPYQITATTGIAALQVNGTTIHSWAGIGLGDKVSQLLS